jgi:hypothetical protein
MISDERYQPYCKEVSKNTVNKLQSKKERVRGQILIDAAIPLVYRLADRTII